MIWKTLDKQQPIHGQRILIYSPAMKDHIDEFLVEGIWPISTWNEEKNACQDEDGECFKITQWSEFILPSEVRIEAPKTNVKRPKNNKGFNFWS